ICSKRRLDAIAKTVNQIAKTQKLPAKHINQGFFDPSRLPQHKHQPRELSGEARADACENSSNTNMENRITHSLAELIWLQHNNVLKP
ncbi:hypothetical protein, partial [Acetobacter lambici]